MKNLVQLVLYSDMGSALNNWSLLVFRVLLSIELFRVHGMKKFRTANGQKEQVPNPLHLPARLNSLFAMFADTIVPVLVVLGLATRPAVLATIGVTATGYFVVHRKDSPEVRDVPYMYTLSFLLLLLLGAGTLSLDHYLYHLITG